MKIKNNIIICILLGLIWQGLAQDKPLTKKQMYADFDELITILQDCNPQLPVRKAVTNIYQLEMAKSLRTNIDTINDRESFSSLLSQVLNCMYDIHAKKTNDYDSYDNLKNIDTAILIYRKNNAKRPVYQPFVTLIGNPIYVNGEYFLGGLYQFIDIEKNDTLRLFYSKILAYNNIPYKKYIQETLNEYPSEGIRWNIQSKEYYHIFPTIPYSGILTVEDNKKVINLDLNRKYGINISQSDTIIKLNIPNKDRAINETIFYSDIDSVLFIGLNSMYDPKKEIAKKIKEIGKDKPIDKIIIDVRGNNGGSDFVWHSILKAIVADSLLYNPILAFKNTKRVKKLYNYPNAFYDIKKLEIRKFDWLPEETFLVTNFKPDYILPDSNSLKYKGKIYILQNEEVYSAAHSLASYASHIKQLVSVGEPSGLLAGFGLSPALFQLKYSKFTFRLETAIDVSNVIKVEDVYQNIPEIIVKIPTEKKLEYEQDWHYNRHYKEYLYNYDYLFQKVLDMK